MPGTCNSDNSLANKPVEMNYVGSAFVHSLHITAIVCAIIIFAAALAAR
jgi:hypothetical protein